MNPRVSHNQSHAQLWKVDDVRNVMRDNLIGGPFAAEVVRVLTSELFPSGCIPRRALVAICSNLPGLVRMYILCTSCVDAADDEDASEDQGSGDVGTVA